MAGTGKASKSKIPLKHRVMAWWEGYDTEQYHNHIVKNTLSGLPVAADAKTVKPAKPENVLETALDEKAQAYEKAEQAKAEQAMGPNTPVDVWSPARIEIAQFVWGPGYCGPGGPEYIVNISKLLTLNPEMSMADVGAGLGGPMRSLVEQYGVWAMGYEESPVVVTAGNELSKMAGLTKKAPLVQFELSADFTFDRRYDRFIIKDKLHVLENKRGFVENVEAALKHDGMVLVMDYVLAEEAAVGTQSYKEWRDGEASRPHMITQKEFADMLTKAGLGVRVNEDRSQEHVDLITQAWSGVDNLLAKLVADPETKHLVTVLAKEAELWNRRVKALQEGRIRYCRFVAAKRPPKSGMMSNW